MGEAVEPEAAEAEVAATEAAELETEISAYRALRAAQLKDAHHIIQDAAVRDVPGYSSMDAPAIRRDGPSNIVGTQHYLATQAQVVAQGGTYALHDHGLEGVRFG